MAWTDIKDDDNRRNDNELLTYNSALTLLKEINSESKFYETELAEVLHVFTDTEHENFPRVDNKPDLSYVGGVIARYIYSEQGMRIDNCKKFKPLNPHINTLPVVGELVVGVNYGEDDDSDSRYYLTTFNKEGFSSFNDGFNSSIGNIKNTLSSNNINTPNKLDSDRNSGFYFKNNNLSRLLPDEGDTIIEGRFGNSIRLGSYQKNDNTKLSSKIHITTGRNSILESVVSDSSTIKLSENQPTSDLISSAFLPKAGSFETSFPESEIFINSNQIIINSKNNGNIGILSSGNITIGAQGDTVFEIPDAGEVKFGSGDATEPVVMGNELKKIIDILLDAEIAKNEASIQEKLTEAATKTAAAGGTPTPEVIQLTTEAGELKVLNTEHKQTQQTDPYLSQKIKTI